MRNLIDTNLWIDAVAGNLPRFPRSGYAEKQIVFLIQKTFLPCCLVSIRYFRMGTNDKGVRLSREPT
jgi:hypothetical protein